MNEVTNSFNTGLRSFFDYLPALLGGLLLILAAWVVAILVRKAIEKGLRAVDLDAKLVKWCGGRGLPAYRSSQVVRRIVAAITWQQHPKKLKF